MAIDSIIAKPMNSVRLMVPASSGCWAMEPSACATALASPMAGPIEPMAMHSAAAAIETTATTLTLSIESPYVRRKKRKEKTGTKSLHSFLPALHRGGYVNHGQNGKNIGLDQPHQQSQKLHEHGDKQRRERQQHGHDHRSAHDVYKQPDRQRQVARG